MGAFLKRCTWFLLLAGGLALGTDQLLMHGLRLRRTHTFGQWNRLRNGELRAQVLFTGSSRCLMHYDARAIGSALGRRCWNLGMDGSQLDLQRPWLITYLKYNPPPELIVQEVDIISLEPDSDVYFPSQYPPYLLEQPILNTLTSIDPSWNKDRWIPLYSFTRFGYTYAGLGVKGLLGREDTVHDILRNGFELRHWAWDGGFDRFKQKYPDGRPYPITEHSINVLRDIIRIAKAAGSSIVLVYAPELDENQRLTTNRAEVLGTYRRIAREEGIPFWDFSVLPLCAERELFYNSQHMNGHGVRRFTPVITDSLSAWYAINARGPGRRVP